MAPIAKALSHFRKGISAFSAGTAMPLGRVKTSSKLDGQMGLCSENMGSTRHLESCASSDLALVIMLRVYAMARCIEEHCF